MRLLKSVLLSALSITSLSLPVRASAADTAFQDVDSKLDKGGSVYLYVDGRDSFQSWGAKIDELGSIITQLSAAQSPDGEAQEDVRRFFKGVSAAYRASGLAEVDAYGFSASKRDDALFNHKGVIRCPSDKAIGFLWKAFGRKPENLGNSIAILPQTTSFAFFSDFDAKALRAAMKSALKNEHADGSLTKLEESEAEAKANGFDLDKLLESYDGQFAVIVALDDKNKIPLPLPGGQGGMPSLVEFPTPGGAVLLKVKDEALFNAIAAKSPDLSPADRDGAKILEGALTHNSPVTLQMSMAQKGQWLFISSSGKLTDSILAAMDGGPSLANSEAFQRLSKGVALEGNSFVYYDNAIMKHLNTLAPLLKNMPGGIGVMPRFLGLLGFERELVKVVRQDSPSTILLSGTGSYSGAPSLGGGAQGIAPFAITAGMLLPALNSARSKARQISDASNLKQIGLGIKQYAIDHSDKFPEKSGAEGLEALRAENYLSDPKIFVNPNSSRKPLQQGVALSEAGVSYVYIGGLTEADSPDLPLAFDKPGDSKGLVNVLFIDGHVQGFQMHASSASEFATAVIELHGKNLPEDVKRAFLEKVLLYEMSVTK